MTDDEYLRDFFAGLAMIGLMMSGVDWKAKHAYEVADEMMESRKIKDEKGIAGIEKRKYTRKND